ncbi:glycosyltransferase family 2 protein [Clostridium intestinale]|uniref:Glycosyltransferase family 2 protein n=1 Tax=Clostridium intestinale TaxID=36845 RepID=A0A7D7A293_9CLOT|nr:glycosyltransferase family 2 protein [Clostridium intestinale]QLY79138.1 glycosyltransferase family 2 protein [Clostridium intestinale]
MNRDVCALIVSYNPDKDLIESCKTLLNKVDKIIIVDNASSEEFSIKIIKEIEKYEEKIEVIYNRQNYGIAKALNIGFERIIELGYIWALTLDDDSIIDNNMVYNMLSIYNLINRDDIGIIAPRYIEKRYYNSIILCKDSKVEYEYVDFAITSGNLVNVNIYVKIKGYDESLFIDYVDYDFCFKLLIKGYKILKINSAIMIHSLGESKFVSIGKFKFAITNHDAFRRYYMTRNRIILWNRYNNIFYKWVKKDRLRFFNETIKIILFEKDKISKLISIYKGIRDSNNKY